MAFSMDRNACNNNYLRSGIGQKPKIGFQFFIRISSFIRFIHQIKKFGQIRGYHIGFCAEWKKLDIQFDAFYTGYLGSPRQIQIVSDFIDDDWKVQP